MAPDVRATGDITSIIPRFYDKVMLERLVARARLYNLAEKKPIPKGTGTTIYFNRFTNFPTTTTPLTEGEVPTQTYLSGTSVSATLIQLGGWTATSDMLSMTAVTNVVTECVQNFADCAATSIDTTIMYLLLSQESITSEGSEGPWTDTAHISTWWYANQGGLSTVYVSANGSYVTKALLFSLLSTDVTATAGHVLDLDKIQKVVSTLRSANVRPFSDGYYYAVVHPKAMREIVRTSEWQSWNNATNQGQDALYRGELGKAGGVKFFDSSLMYLTRTGPISSATATVSVVFTMIFGQGCFGVTELGGERGVRTYVKNPNSYDTGNPIDQWSTIGWKTTFAAKVLNPNCGYFLMSVVA